MAGRLKNDFVDNNQNGLKRWVAKHNLYSSREAREIVKRDSATTNKKRRIYDKLPLFLRALLYFKYRYIVRLGFLDGREGLIFHSLQGFWYRFLVDAKLSELRAKELPDNAR